MAYSQHGRRRSSLAFDDVKSEADHLVILSETSPQEPLASDEHLIMMPIQQVHLDEPEVLLEDSFPSEVCKICDSDLTPATRVSLGRCDHIFCADCFKDYLETKTAERSVVEITCPAFNCPVVLKEEEMKTLMSELGYEKLIRFRKEAELEMNPDLRWCPRPNCEGYDYGNVNKRKLTCQVCQYNYCFYCLEAWHQSGKCKAEIDRKLDNWVKSHKAKFCPRCRIRIEKHLGCNHMTCTKCKYEFCWLCGAPFNVEHINKCEVTRLKKRNPPWYICLGIFMMPVLVPFAFLIFTVVCIRKYLDENGDEGCFYHFLKMWWLSYPLLLLLALVLTPLAFIIVIFFVGGIFLIQWGRYVMYDRSSCLQKLAKKQCLWGLLSILIGMMLSPLAVTLVVLIAALGPFVGLGLFLFKVIILCIRCCCDKEFMKPKGVPGYLVG